MNSNYEEYDDIISAREIEETVLSYGNGTIRTVSENSSQKPFPSLTRTSWIVYFLIISLIAFYLLIFF